MVLDKLQTTNFRNLSLLDMTPDPGINIIVGDNAQGKTNLIEAINLLLTTKSFKADRDNEMVAWNTEFARVYGKADHSEIEMLITRNGKEIKVNNMNSRALETVGVMSGILFIPSDIEMLKDSPSVRRRFLDILISKINRKYLYELSLYNQVIKNRNKVLYWLKVGKLGGTYKAKRDDLEIWNSQLVTLGSSITLTRASYIEKLTNYMKEFGATLLASETVLVYQSKFKETHLLTELTKEFETILASTLEDEIDKTSTLTGPHRDDFKIMRVQNSKKGGVDIGSYGSRGEVRSALLALKLSELRITQEEKKEKAILLLDDVLSELDQSHQQHLLNLVSLNQTFITTTSLDFFPASLLKNATRWVAKEGTITKKD